MNEQFLCMSMCGCTSAASTRLSSKFDILHPWQGLSCITLLLSTLEISREGSIIYTCSCMFWTMIKLWRKGYGTPTMLYIVVMSWKQCRMNAILSASQCAIVYHLMTEVELEEKCRDACWGGGASCYACYHVFQHGDDQQWYNFPLHNQIVSVPDTGNRYQEGDQ